MAAPAHRPEEEVHQFNFSRHPSGVSRTLDYRKLTKLVHDTGELWRQRGYGVEAVATFMSESGTGDARYRHSDPRAYLARVKLPPREYFIVRNGQTVYRTQGYEDIRAECAALPDTLSLQSARNEMRKLECAVISADRGVAQNNEEYDPVPDHEAFELEHNLERAYKTFLDWDKTYNAWMANRNGLHERFMPYAERTWGTLYP